MQIQASGDVIFATSKARMIGMSLAGAWRSALALAGQVLTPRDSDRTAPRAHRFNASRRLFVALFALVAFSGAAMAEPWVVVRSSGEVWIGSRSVQPVALGSETELKGGTVVVTGKRGRAMLERGEQTMVVGPNAHVTLPGEMFGKSTVLQRAGTVLFEVDKRRVKHFSVETPFLAAVVKGTKFEVSVKPDSAYVSVREGTVEVRNLRTGEYANVTARQRAAVNGPDAPLTLSGAGATAADIQQGSRSRPSVRPLHSDDMDQIQARASGVVRTASLSVLGGGPKVNNSAASVLGAADKEVAIRRSFRSRDDDQESDGVTVVALAGSSGGGSPDGGDDEDDGGEAVAAGDGGAEVATNDADAVGGDLVQSAGSTAVAANSITNWAPRKRKEDEGLSTWHVVLGILSMTFLVLGVGFVRARFG